MIHLTDNQIFYLAAATVKEQPYDDNQLLCLEHLRECEGCFRKFCASLAVQKSVAQGLEEIELDNRISSGKHEKLLATIKILKSRNKSKPSYELVQFADPYQKLMFTPKESENPSTGNDISVRRYEDVSHKMSCVTIDNQSKRLNIQIDTQPFDGRDIDIYICDGSNKTILPSSKINDILVANSFTLSKDTKIQIEMR